MNSYLAGAAVLASVVGLAHSTLGEVMIFSRLRRGNEVVPTSGGTVLPERQLRILWASWHVLTAFGWSLAAVLWLLADEAAAGALRAPVARVVAAAMLAGSVIVCYGTKARHPGWLGLLGVAALSWMGSGG